MKASFFSTVLASMLGIPILVAAGPAGAEAGLAAPKADGPGGMKGIAPPNTPFTTTVTPTIASSTSSISSKSTPNAMQSSVSSARLSTMTNTIDVSSFMTSASSTSPLSSTTLSAASIYGNVASSISSTTSAVSNHTSNSDRTLIIVLSAVLGSLAILLIAGAIFLAYRFGQKRGRFGRRGATPINDDEIDSWRGTSTEQKKPLPPADPAMLNRKSDSDTIALTHSPGWTWTASPTSLRSEISPTTTVPDTPPFLARAPNSRPGLTDETIPGADAFIPPIKRQSSRLSKAQPGHGRSKSRRSSMSTKSVRSYGGGIGPNTDSPWYDPEDHMIKQKLSRIDLANSTPGTSIYEGKQGGGASPRPSSQLRPWERNLSEIGRAIA